MKARSIINENAPKLAELFDNLDTYYENFVTEVYCGDSEKIIVVADDMTSFFAYCMICKEQNKTRLIPDWNSLSDEEKKDNSKRLRNDLGVREDPFDECNFLATSLFGLLTFLRFNFSPSIYPELGLILKLQDPTYKLVLDDIKSYSVETFKKVFNKNNTNILQKDIEELFYAIPEHDKTLIEKFVEIFKDKLPELAKHEKYKNREIKQYAFSSINGCVCKSFSQACKNVKDIPEVFQPEWEKISRETNWKTLKGKLEKFLSECSKNVKLGKLDVSRYNAICSMLASRESLGRIVERRFSDSKKGIVDDNGFLDDELNKQMVELVQQSRSDLIKHFEDQYNQCLNPLKEFLEKSSKTEKDLCIATVVTATVPVITSGLKLIELLGGSKVLELVLGQFTNLGLRISSDLGVVALGLAVATAVKILVDYYKIKQMAIDIEKRPKTEEEKKAGEKLSALRTGNEDIKNAINSINQKRGITLQEK